MSNYRAPKRRTIAAHWTAQMMYPNRAHALTGEIERAVTDLFPSQPYATHGSVCADLLLWKLIHNERAGRSPASWRETIIREVLTEHVAMVGTILVYSHNDRQTKKRVPRSPSGQRDGFRRNLFAAYPLAVSALERIRQSGESQSSSSGQPMPSGVDPEPPSSAPEYARSEPVEPLDPSVIEAIEADPIEPEPIEPEGAKLGSIIIGSTDPLRAHHEWSVAVREAMVERGLSWSMRPTIDGIALIGAGCPPEAVRDACLMDYPEDLRSQLGVSEAFDFAGFGTVDYLVKAAGARVDDRGKLRPVCLAMVGPAGTGKTTLATVLAEKLDVDRYDVSMSGGTPMSAFYGIDRLNAELTLSDFERWATGGGIHLFDEMDCSDPNLLKIVNKALANRDYTNPLSGKRIELSPDAVAVAGMNTLGVGIQAEYSAAEQLDFSTIDRFRAGRIRVDIDEKLESTIVDAQIASIRS